MNANKDNMIVINGVRYRREDAPRHAAETIRQAMAEHPSSTPAPSEPATAEPVAEPIAGVMTADEAKTAKGKGKSA